MLGRRVILVKLSRKRFAGTGLGRQYGRPDVFAAPQPDQQPLTEVSASDPAALFGTGLVLVTVAVLASFIPARRATQVDPTTVLRSE